jgi:hypothetical protein
MDTPFLKGVSCPVVSSLMIHHRGRDSVSGLTVHPWLHDRCPHCGVEFPSGFAGSRRLSRVRRRTSPIRSEAEPLSRTRGQQGVSRARPSDHRVGAPPHSTGGRRRRNNTQRRGLGPTMCPHTRDLRRDTAGTAEQAKSERANGPWCAPEQAPLCRRRLPVLSTQSAGHHQRTRWRIRSVSTRLAAYIPAGLLAALNAVAQSIERVLHNNEVLADVLRAGRRVLGEGRI